MLDKKGKLFGKISVVDILVVVMVLVMIAGAFVVWQKINDNTVLTENKSIVQNSDLDSLDVSMRLKSVRQMTMDAIHIDDDVYMKDTGKYLGKVVSISSEPAKQLIFDLKGNPVMAESPERMDVIMVVRVPGKRLQNGFYTADNIQLVYNSSFEIVTPTIQTNPIIENITTVTGE